MTKERLLDAGVTEFAQYGIAGARVDRIAASGAEDIRAAFAPLIEARERAQLKIELRRERSCHHCGAPSPGSICRYCNTAHRRTTT